MIEQKAGRRKREVTRRSTDAASETWADLLAQAEAQWTELRGHSELAPQVMEVQRMCIARHEVQICLCYV